MIPMRLSSMLLLSYHMDRAMMMTMTNRLENMKMKMCVYSNNFTRARARGIMNQPQHSTDDQRDGSLIGSSSSKAIKNLTLDVNQTSNQELPTSQPQNLTYPVVGIDKIPSHNWELFSLIQPRSRNLIRNTRDIKSIEELDIRCIRLESGVVHLKGYLSLCKQVKIVNICQEFGLGPGGFYQPCNSNGWMMCFGRNWDPQTKYHERVREDGSKAPPLPHKLISLVETAVRDTRFCLKLKSSSSKHEIPLMSPDICKVNFSTTADGFGLHQDLGESSYSLRRQLHVVSISIGDAAEFLYGSTRDVKKANKVLLKSGDVLIFGGKSRHVFHGVTKIIPDSTPLPLLLRTMLRPGRLNLTFKQF